MRKASCSRDISMLKMPTFALAAPNAAFSAMLSAKVVLPIEGRPAMTIRSPFCRPAVISSSLLKPVLTPVSAP